MCTPVSTIYQSKKSHCVSIDFISIQTAKPRYSKDACISCTYTNVQLRPLAQRLEILSMPQATVEDG